MPVLLVSVTAVTSSEPKWKAKTIIVFTSISANFISRAKIIPVAGYRTPAITRLIATWAVGFNNVFANHH
jgi:hypothetical protein